MALKIEELINEFCETGNYLSKISEKILEFEQIRSSLETKREDICRKINERQRKKGEVYAQNKALDYCFWFFGEDAYKRLPLVEEFLNQVEEMHGQRILTVRENEQLETGIINGKGKFDISKGVLSNARELYVPVRDYHIFEAHCFSWKKDNKGIWINKDIFRKSNLFFNQRDATSDPIFVKKAFKQGYAWEVDYTPSFYIGPKPNNWAVYLGDKLVKNVLKKICMKIPEKTRQIPSLI